MSFNLKNELLMKLFVTVLLAVGMWLPSFAQKDAAFWNNFLNEECSSSSITNHYLARSLDENIKRF